jgi:hypothetical protein
MTVLIILTLVSIVVAVVMSVVALRTTAEERRRSDARVARLAADIFEPDFELHPSSTPADRPAPAVHAPIARERQAAIVERPGVDTHAAPATADLFATTQPEPSGSRLATAAVFGVLVVGSLATVALLLGSGSHGAVAATAAESRSGRENGANAAARGEPAPLELVALGHEREADHLTVRGVVRNPSSGTVVDGLAAVVFLFGRDGNFISSSRTDVETTHLTPGGESRFVVNVPTAADIGRYRVSFRTDDRVIPHVDRREPALARK